MIRFPIRIALAAVVATGSLAGFVACGGDDSGPATLSEDGFPFTFEYPGDWEPSDDVSLGQELGGTADETIAVGLDDDNAIILQRFTLSVSIDEGNLDRARKEFDGLIAAIDPEAAGEAGEVGGYLSLEYEGVALSMPPEGESRLIVLFEGDQEYFLNCQSTPENREEVESACDRALETIEPIEG